MIIPKLLLAFSLSVAFAAEIEKSSDYDYDSFAVSVSSIPTKGNMICTKPFLDPETTYMIELTKAHENDESEGEHVPLSKDEKDACFRHVPSPTDTLPIEGTATIISTNLEESKASSADLVSDDLEIPASFDDYWNEQGLPSKPETYLEDREEESFAIEREPAMISEADGITVHDKSYTFEALREMILNSDSNKIEPNGVTDQVNARINELLIVQLVSMMADVLDQDAFRKFLASTVAVMSINIRCAVIANLINHLAYTFHEERKVELMKFFAILAEYPVVLAAVNAYHYLEGLKEIDESFVNTDKPAYLDSEIRRVDAFIGQRVQMRIDELKAKLIESRYAEALQILRSEYPPIKMSFITFLNVFKSTTFSAERYAFVRQALAGDHLDPNLKNPNGEHILIVLAASSLNCNDLVKALLLDPRTDLECESRYGRSPRHIAKHNESLPKNDRKVLIALFKAKTHSQDQLDSILPL